MNCKWERKFIYGTVRWTHYLLYDWRLKTFHYLIQKFDETNFSELNKNQTE